MLQDLEEYQGISFTPNNWFAGAIIYEETGKLTDYRQLIKNENHRLVWSRSFANELERFLQVIRYVKGTSTMKFISHSQVPKGRTVTYGRIVVDYRPHKPESDRTRLTMGGNRIYYPDGVSTPADDITTSRVLINPTISTPGAKLFSMDVKNST